MKLSMKRLSLTLLVLLYCLTPSLSAVSDPALASIEDLDTLTSPEKRSGILESVDYIYVRHPILCTIGFTIASFIVLLVCNPDVNKRVRSIVNRLLEQEEQDDEMVYHTRTGVVNK